MNTPANRIVENASQPVTDTVAKMADTLTIRGATSKTNWALLLLIFIMPLRNIQLQYIPNLGGGLNIINLLFLLAFAHASMNGKPLKIKPSINGFLVFYIFSSILALFMGYQFLGDDSNGLWKTMKDQLIPIFLVFIIQKSAVDDTQWRRILMATLVSLPYCFKVVWAQYRSVSSWHYSDDLRIAGTFMDLGANEMGAFSVTLALMCFALMISCWNLKKWRYAFMVGFVLAALCLLYSYSRGGYISLILGITVIFLRFKNRKEMLLPLILAVVIGLANLPKSVEERFSSIDAEEGERDESADSRFVFWAIVLEKWTTRPAFGFGYHTVQNKRINPHEMDTHNYFVKAIVERGVVGFVILLILLRMCWNLTKRNLYWEANDPMHNGLILGLSGAIFALILGSMFGDRFSHYPISTCFWTFVALTSVIESRRLEKEQPAEFSSQS
jgi:putative inorganic carbon (HCO3(-)) transporter